MLKWVEYLQLGAKIFAGIQLLLAGQSATFTFSWKGKTYHLMLQLTAGELAALQAARVSAKTRSLPNTGDPNPLYIEPPVNMIGG